MKNLYLYFAGMVMLASGYLMVTDTGYSAEQASYQPAPVGIKEKVRRAASPKKLLLSPLSVTRASASRAAAGITAITSYQITRDNGATGATAGDEITYTVTITNPGTALNDFTYTSTLDTNTTLIEGSVTVSPLAQDERYDALGNVGITIPAANGLFANDRSPDGSAFTLISAASLSTARGGSATITPETGAFTYDPPAGYTGLDTLSYTIQSTSGLSMQAKAVINITKKIWFINGSASGSSAGTLSNPFTSLASFQAANTGQSRKPGTDDYIFIYSGNYNGAIKLLSGQKLIGQATPYTLQQLTGFSLPFGSAALPPTAGAAPVLTTSGSGIDAITLGTNNNLRGFNIDNTSGKKIKGTAFGTVTMNEIQLTGNGAALDLTSGKLEIMLPVLSSNANGTAAIRLTEVTGNLNNTSGTVSATNAAAIQISTSSARPALALGLNFTAVSSSGTAKGISVINASGQISVTGTGTAGSGGTIRDVTQRGAEFINTENITLRYVSFINANTADGAGGTDNTNSNGAIHMENVNKPTLNNITVSGTTRQYGLNFKDVSNFALTNSSFLNCGDSDEDGGIFAANSKGNSTIANVIIGQPAGRGAYFRNNTGELNSLTISNSTISDIPNGQALLVEGYGSAVMNVTVNQNNQLLRSQSAGIAVYANEQSVIKPEILNNTINPGSGVGTGIDLAASGTSTITYNILDNTVISREGSGINIFSFESSNVQGNIKRNTVNLPGYLGSGIAARNESVTGSSRSGILNTNMDRNIVSGVSLENGILVSATSQYSSGNETGQFINTNITNNTISANVAAAGTSGTNIALVFPSIQGNVGSMCANIASNTIPSGTNGEAGLLGIYTPNNVPEANTIFLQGATSVIDSWNSRLNLPTGSASGNTRVYKAGQGKLVFGNKGCTNPVNNNTGNRQIASAEIISENTAALRTALADTVQSTPLFENQIIENTDSPLPIKSRMAVTYADETVTVGGPGFTLPADKSITIHYKVLVNNNIPANVCRISNQGTITAVNLAATLTDDPAVSGSADPTNIPVTPTASPTITRQPLNVLACAGTGAAFTVAAAETGLSYQWQKKTGNGAFTDIDPAENSTATSAVLTLTNVQTTDNATQYQAVVFSPCATITSGLATLTINRIETASISGSASADQNDPMPVITFRAQGGTKPYTFAYTLNGEQKTVQSVDTASTAIASQPTTDAGSFIYELTGVTDAITCGFVPATPQKVTINVTPLPVTLTSFTAVKEGNAARLTWETTMETNSDRFEVERSADGRNWVVIGIQTAEGESRKSLQYTFADSSPAAGENLYRLRMIDHDQTFAYSRIRSLTFNADMQTAMYPNPATDKLNLTVNDWNKVSSVELFTVKGQSVYKSGKLPESAIDVTRLATGLYIISLHYTDGRGESFQVVINR